jgi:holo-[acyl-carrier protein] synthase
MRVGADVVEAAGLARRLASSPGMAEGLFTAAERDAAARRRDPATWLACCFAAKEAFLKALGRGLVPTGPDAWLCEIEVRGEPGRPARLELGPAPARALARRGLAPALALTQAGGYALATVVLA